MHPQTKVEHMWDPLKNPFRKVKIQNHFILSLWLGSYENFCGFYIKKVLQMSHTNNTMKSDTLRINTSHISFPFEMWYFGEYKSATLSHHCHRTQRVEHDIRRKGRVPLLTDIMVVRMVWGRRSGIVAVFATILGKRHFSLLDSSPKDILKLPVDISKILLMGIFYRVTKTIFWRKKCLYLLQFWSYTKILEYGKVWQLYILFKVIKIFWKFLKISYSFKK